LITDRKFFIGIERVYDRYVGTPGGFVEKTETPPEAAARETYEELGIKIPAQKLKHVITHEFVHRRFGKMLIHYYKYVVHDVSALLKQHLKLDSTEISKLVILPADYTILRRLYWKQLHPGLKKKLPQILKELKKV